MPLAAAWAPAQHAPLYGTRTIVLPIQGETPLLYIILRSRLCYELRVPTLEQNQQVQTLHYTIIVNFRREKMMQRYFSSREGTTFLPGPKKAKYEKSFQHTEYT